MMIMQLRLNKTKITGWLPYLFFLVWYVFFSFRFFTYAGPDFTAYTSIANKYLQGHFFDAVNGWWSPFYSWSLAFFKFLGFSDLLANKTLSFVFGLGSLFFAYKLIVFFTTSASKYSPFCLLLIAPTLAYYGAITKSPDFFVTFILLSSVYYTLSFLRFRRKRDAIFLGCIAALAYYIKAYNFYFFIISFILLDALLLITTKPLANNLKLISLKWIVFLFLSSLWVGAIYYKYHVKNISLIRELKVCTDQPFSVSNIMHCTGLVAPPDSVSFSAWDDPSHFPTNSSLFGYTFNNNSGEIISKFFNNALKFIKYDLGIWKLLLLIGSIMVLFKRNKIVAFVLTGSFLIFISGYFLIYLEERFVSSAIILATVMICASIVILLEKWNPKPVVSVLLFFLLIILFSKEPAFRLINSEQTEIDQVDNMLSRSATKLPVNKKFAASNEVDTRAFFVPYRAKGKFYGYSIKNISSASLYEELKKYQIDYYITAKELQDTTFLKPIDGLANSPILIYQFKP